MKSKYTYVGVLKPVSKSDKFLTSIFKNNKGKFFTQVDEDEIIKKFVPIKLSRELLSPSKEIEVTVGNEYIYSYQMANSGKLISGNREEVEVALLSFLNSDSVTVHAKLIISSFLKLYQKTLELVDESNKHLEESGVKQQLDPKLIFSYTNDSETESSKLLNSIHKRYESFRTINEEIRLSDIVYLSNHKAYFVSQQLNIETIANNESLKNDRNRKLVSNMIMSCIERDGNMIKILVKRSTETYDFILKSEFLEVDESEIALHLGASRELPLPKDKSYIEESIRLDEEFYDKVDSLKNKAKATASDLTKEMFRIINKFKID